MKKYYKLSLIFLLMALIIYPLWSFASGDDPKPKSSIHDLAIASDVVIPDLLSFYLHNNFAPEADKEPAKDTIAHKPGHGRDVIEGYNGWAGNPDTLAVYIDTTWTEAEKDSCRAAIKRWNDAGSVPKFKEVTKAADAKITITKGNPGAGNAGLYSWKTNAEGKVTGGTITIAGDTSPLSLKEVVTHELGHAIGLDDTDEAANAGDVMKGSGPSNGSDGNLSKHDSTEMRQAGAAITALAEAPKERRRAIAPEQAIFPGQFEELIFPLSDFFPPSMPLIVEPIADDQLFVEYFFINGNELHVGLFTDPLHGSGKLYLDVVLFPPDQDPIEFWGMHFINTNPVLPIEFSCPFEATQIGDMVHVNWVDYCDYPFTNPLHSELIVDGNTHYKVKPNGDYAIKLTPGLHQLHLIVDDYQINRMDSFFDIEYTITSVPWEDGFEYYAVGDDIVGQGGWEFWFGGESSPSARVTDTQVHTGGQALEIMGAEDPVLADDILHQFSGCNSGAWKFTTWQFIPLSAAGGTTYITLLDQYGNDIDECHWGTQLKFDPDVGTVESDYDGATLPLLKGQWVEIDVVINFDDDWQTISYNGQILTEKSWTLGVPQAMPGILNLAAIDLFANTLNTPVYYDDFVITDEFENFPIVIFPPDVFVSNDPDMCGAAGVYLGVPEIINPDGTEVISNDAPNFLPVGTTMVIWTVINSGGYTVTGEQLVTVMDVQEPNISPMADLALSNDPGACGAVAEWEPPVATDNCGIESLSGNHEPGEVFPVGLTEVVYTATDVSGNQAYAGFTVAVLDTEEPVFESDMPDLEVSNDPGQCGAALTWEWPLVTDNCGIESLSGSHEPGEVFPVGLTEVVYTATDMSGNQAYAGFTVAVLDTEEPVFESDMPDLEVPNDPGACGAAITWEWPLVTDNCGIESLSGNYEPGTFFPVGLTDVVYTATDVSGNQAYAGFTVAVLDTEEPTFEGDMPDLEVPNDPGACGAAITWEWPLVTDNCGIESLSGNYEPGTFFPVGLTDVVYTATDIAGNQSYDGFTVTVFDIDPPDVSCPGDMTVSQSSPPFTLSGATPEGGTYEGSGVSGGVFYPADAGGGSHQINYLYLNPSSGCTYGCAFTIHVTGGAAQIIQIPEGWSGISSFIQPEPPLIDLVLSPIIDQLIMLYNFDGMFYPGQNINTLGEWDVHSGYVVKVTDDVLLTIDGDETPDKTIFVNEGWTIIPVLSSNPVFAEMLFGGLDQLVIVKDVAGPGVYWPQFGINTLGFVEPGKSYFVLMNAPTTINFGIASTKSHYDGKPAELINSPWSAVVPGPASHVVAFRLVENVFQNGDIVGGFNADGACTGLVQLTDANAPFALTVFGNTAFARISNGLEPGETISYRLSRPSTGETFSLEVRYKPAMNTGTFENNGLSEVKSVKLAPVGVSELLPLKVSIYPNPNDGIFTIDGNGEQVELEIFNAFGEQVYSSDAMLPHNVDLSQQAGGVYFIKLTSTKGGYYGKVIIK